MDTEKGTVSAFKCLNKKTGGVFGITWTNSRVYCTKNNLGNLSTTTRDRIFGEQGYGPFVSKNSEEENDEVPHFNWMIGLMRKMAELEGLGLDLVYSAYEPKGAIRTVIFRTFPKVDGWGAKTMLPVGCSGVSYVTDFFKRYLSADDLQACDGLFMKKYIIPVFEEASLLLNKEDYTLISDSWVELGRFAGLKTTPSLQNPWESEKKKDRLMKKAKLEEEEQEDNKEIIVIEDGEGEKEEKEQEHCEQEHCKSQDDDLDRRRKYVCSKCNGQGHSSRSKQCKFNKQKEKTIPVKLALEIANDEEDYVINDRMILHRGGVHCRVLSMMGSQNQNAVKRKAPREGTVRCQACYKRR